ncbi:MAG: 1-deoxy-D-xylulose-5-phosphate synthase [Thermoleophilia bacterium]|nr:1-deoxy-D-xylulose-5-phosphate synthase [Thermoleophilia bacterium]
MSDDLSRYPTLASISSPADLKGLGDARLQELAEEMRRAIIDTVAETGGHLGSSLGTVELTIALHTELDSPRDRILWDVGHQAYGHKLLTGRLDRFGSLRQYGGLSGFLRREESEHDIMGAGHASTSISYGTGLAEAQRVAARRDARVVAVIGDGALTGGMAYEGLNQAGALGSPLTVVLNDNGMSISENVGALAGALQRARLDPTLTRVRHEIERGLRRVPGVGDLESALSNAAKSLFIPGLLFEALGFAYTGPIDGHDIGAVRSAIARAVSLDRPVLVHVKTTKGRGYAPAEADGEAMHGATPFSVSSGKAAPKAPSPPAYTEVFGRALVAEAERDPRVVGITAAMLKGTGVQHLLKRFPERTYDVGIAEQHAVVFACGLAIAGYRPVCAVYSTFLQRAFDPIVHDAALQGLPVVFAIDRAGLVGDDGPTHHGAFDIAYLRSIPGMTLMAPMDEAELVDMLHTALRIDGPVAIRYPRGAGPGVAVPERPSVLEVGVAQVLEHGERVAMVGYGAGAALAAAAADVVAEDLGVRPTVVNARFAKPLDEALMRRLARSHELVVTIEDHAVLGGFGAAVLEALEGEPVRVMRVGLPDRFIDHGKREILLAEAGLTPEAIGARVVGALVPAVRRGLAAR